MSYQCPVCFYDQLLDPPEDFNICPCCGTEFGNDDFDMTHAELRKRWKAGGALWFSEYTPSPMNWSAVAQLDPPDEQIYIKPALSNAPSLAVKTAQQPWPELPFIYRSAENIWQTA